MFVRDMHTKAQKRSQEHVIIAPVLLQAEGETVEIPRGFDPSAIQLLGNLTGQPPYRGTLEACRLARKDYKLPAPPRGWTNWCSLPPRSIYLDQQVHGRRGRRHSLDMMTQAAAARIAVVGVRCTRSVITD